MGGVEWSGVDGVDKGVMHACVCVRMSVCAHECVCTCTCVCT